MGTTRNQKYFKRNDTRMIDVLDDYHTQEKADNIREVYIEISKEIDNLNDTTNES